MEKEKINVAYVKSAKIWLWSIGKSRSGQTVKYSDIEKLANKEGRVINR